ncbi:hypothetical protein LAN13_20810, partial [Mycobacterium tuberculosis]|nr:hypothetical protein [Mycobacterium tuberculosis]
MRPALARRLLLMTLLLVSLTLFATTLGAMRLPLVNLLPSGDDMLRHSRIPIRRCRRSFLCRSRRAPRHQKTGAGVDGVVHAAARPGRYGFDRG